MATLIAPFALSACASTASPGAVQPVAAASTAQAAAQPETEAGLRAAATQFYAFYAASQWPQAWQLLAPASQQAVPEATYTAVHEGCPASGAGLARVIKSVVMAGSTAVVTETFEGVASALGTKADAWSYADGRWGLAMSQADLAVYTHGSAAADVAAAKAAGDCAGTPAAPPTPPPVPTVVVPPVTFAPPAPPTFATMAPPTMAPLPTFAVPSPLPTS